MVFGLSGEAEFSESSHRKRRRAPLLQLKASWCFGFLQPAAVQQTEEQETFSHVLGVGQHVVALDQLLLGGWVTAVSQQNLHTTRTYKTNAENQNLRATKRKCKF